jgi:hypothetical protein
VIAVYWPKFGSRNDKDIVKHDDNVRAIRHNRLFASATWQYYDCGENVRSERGMYLICNNGYLLWPTSICQYSKANNATQKGFFSTNMESVQKDVECTFGILKKRWKVLNYGFKHRDIVTCEHIFITCCVLHNFSLNLMVRNHVRAGRGYPMSGHTVNVDNNAPGRLLLVQFGMRRKLLANHLRVFKKKGPIA